MTVNERMAMIVLFAVIVIVLVIMLVWWFLVGGPTPQPITPAAPNAQQALAPSVPSAPSVPPNIEKVGLSDDKCDDTSSSCTSRSRSCSKDDRTYTSDDSSSHHRSRQPKNDRTYTSDQTSSYHSLQKQPPPPPQKDPSNTSEQSSTYQSLQKQPPPPPKSKPRPLPPVVSDPSSVSTNIPIESRTRSDTGEIEVFRLVSGEVQDKSTLMCPDGCNVVCMLGCSDKLYVCMDGDEDSAGIYELLDDDEWYRYARSEGRSVVSMYAASDVLVAVTTDGNFTVEDGSLQPRNGHTYDKHIAGGVTSALIRTGDDRYAVHLNGKRLDTLTSGCNVRVHQGCVLYIDDDQELQGTTATGKITSYDVSDDGVLYIEDSTIYHIGSDSKPRALYKTDSTMIAVVGNVVYCA